MIETKHPVRVLVVDDSAVMRSLLRITLANCPQIELVGVSVDGAAGLDAIERLKPDLVLLDIEMPRMNGLEVLAEMRRRHLEARVIMCSTLTRRGASITLEALARGATDYVAKPTAEHGAGEAVELLRRELLPRIQALFLMRERASRTGGSPVPAIRAMRQSTSVRLPSGALAIGVSTGGPAALETFLPSLPSDFGLPVFVVQHMPPLFTAMLAERLRSVCRVPVHEAAAAEPVQAGSIYIARGDWHLKVVGSPARCFLRLVQSVPEQSCRPSVDVLFRSVAEVFGAEALGVVLTGMGSDGLEGCRVIHAAGGRVLVQDRETSAVWGMPGAVADAGLADRILPLNALAAEVIRCANQNASRKPA